MILDKTLALIAEHDKLEVEQPLGSAGFEAVFDVDAVFDDELWMSELRARGLRSRDGRTVHDLHPLYVRFKEEYRGDDLA